ncbi:MAG: hypothetical protein JNM76_14735 [Betaproteobacteria bacterium]|nr:hypothetical protein [Betaproteobacteria bacterium]
MSLLAARTMFCIQDEATGLVTDPVPTYAEAEMQLPPARPASMKVVPVLVEISRAEWPAAAVQAFGQLPLHEVTP